MSTIVTRSGKGSPLTNTEVDANFTNLNTGKAELSGAVFTGAITTNSTIDGRDVATDGTKLDGVEASADVTDATNVTAAGALMDSELTSIASVKALNQGVATGDSPTFAEVTVSAGELSVTTSASGVNTAAFVNTHATSPYGLYVDASNFSGDGTVYSFRADNSGGSIHTMLTNGNASHTGLLTAGTITSTGVLTANAGVVVDNFTLDGTTLALSSGDLTLDAAGDIILDADGADVILKDGGTSFLEIDKDGDNARLKNPIADGDIKIQGIDGASTITALTLDMSEAGEATFNGDIKLGDGKVARFGTDQDFRIGFDGNNAVLQNVTSDSDIIFIGKDGGSTITALTLDMSASGAATFNSTLSTGNMTISGQEIDVSQNDLTLDVAGNIFLNADGSLIVFADGGVEFGRVGNSSSDFAIQSLVQDKDIVFKGNDNGTIITALTLDMSAAGAASFNSSVTASGSVTTENHFAVIPPTTTNYAYMDYSNAGGSMYVGRERSSASGLLTGSTAYAGVINVIGAYPLEFGTNNSKRMTIDSSGNVLVGKSANTISLAGAKLGTGGSNFTRSGAEVVYFNRTTNDGAIATFAKDGTTVGSIGSLNGDLYLDSTGGELSIRINGTTLYEFDSNLFYPKVDNSKDLGHSGGRWKDAYLSGGIYLGGTGAANKLDDYEEGTWTPSWVGTTSTQTTNMATYTKIGNIVHLNLYISNISPATSNDQQLITGLPFTVAGGNFYGAGSISYSASFDVEGIGLLAHTNSNYLYFHYIDGTSGSSPTRNDWNGIASSGLALIMSISYRTDA